MCGSDVWSPGTDYEILTGNFTLVPGNSSVFLPVTVLEDDYVEYDEEWTLTISQTDTSFPPIHISFIIADNDRMSQHTRLLLCIPSHYTLCRCDSGVC